MNTHSTRPIDTSNEVIQSFLPYCYLIVQPRVRPRSSNPGNERPISRNTTEYKLYLSTCDLRNHTSIPIFHNLSISGFHRSVPKKKDAERSLSKV